MFCLDLGELDPLDKRLRWFSRNRWNLYSFFDRDHLRFSSAELFENVREYVLSQGCSETVDRVTLVTLPRVLGYVFNPVSFYFCHSTGGEPICAIAQVGNTFGELKLFYLKDRSENATNRFVMKQTKYFYVSPFFNHDLQFEFDLKVPDAKLVMQVDDYHEKERVLHTTLTGNRMELTDKNMLLLTLKYPLVTLKVIGGIHWEALRLWLKGLAAQKKAEHPELQRDIHRRF